MFLPAGSRAADALEAAGGFAPEAAEEAVNLAAKVSDGEKLYFPARGEYEIQAEQEKATASGLVNINTADAAQLCTLPGIGESRAADIIAYRESHGDFAACEDIMRVSGIKESVYNKISGKITVN
ncbi:MAG: helix-hairpin-helix domain-containing protein [Eubacterium sp.]|nr:helix-hairpin-helix domain-containing protein [Eubacterium sp.]MCM1213174.1 helix-hairpin-helix domain-containing protein [Lachnospiraceae bacterium]MCM1303750.1 helix-hairpin-helix domain-containing protein [Butyrivibrio sp.]MCM1344588.1 helix-hairpin-helix domain-containing protein [Muribaculaceae bacterium]MCM1239478.1 helix-hairpin-helix domain-containing protein [Lachnospiraceae bacterium]